MRTIRKGEKKTGQSASRWPEVRPNLFVAARNPACAKQTDRQHRRPSPHKHNKKRFWLSAIRPETAPQLIAASQKIARSHEFRSIDNPAAKLSRSKPVMQGDRLNRRSDCGGEACGCSRKIYSRCTKFALHVAFEQHFVRHRAARRACDGPQRRVSNHIASGDIDAVALSAPRRGFWNNVSSASVSAPAPRTARSRRSAAPCR